MNFPDLNTQSPVRDFVNHNPVIAIEVFAHHKIDFCCGGEKTLGAACEELGLTPGAILEQLNQAPSPAAAEPEENWTDLEPSGLIDHIVTTHHQYLESVFPELTEITEKVVKAHAANHPWLAELQEAVYYLIQDLKPHMMKEEQILFPMIKNMEKSMSGGMAHCGSVANPIRVMLMEHERAGGLLHKINELTNGYQPPEDACETFKHLYRLLKQVEVDTHLHVHKENNLLFPQVLERAEAL